MPLRSVGKLYPTPDEQDNTQPTQPTPTVTPMLSDAGLTTRAQGRNRKEHTNNKTLQPFFYRSRSLCQQCLSELCAVPDELRGTMSMLGPGKTHWLVG
jgi:hypothetical protein